jgi:hypothetical protein
MAADEPQKGAGKPAAAGEPKDRLPLIVIGGVILAVLIAGGVLLITLGGSDSSSSNGLASPEDVPPNMAQVTHVPKPLGEVTESEFDHALEQAVASSGLKESPAPDSKKYGEMRESALTNVIEAIWIQGQAKEMGIAVTPAQVSAELKHLKKTSFKNEAEYQDFLNTSHYTEEDVTERVRVQVLSTRIQEKVAASAPRKDPGHKSFTKFVTDFQHRWRSRTVCAPDLVVAECSNGEPETPNSSQAEGQSTTPGAEPPG